MNTAALSKQHQTVNGKQMADQSDSRSWPDQPEVTVAGVHVIQENSPDEIGETIAARLQR